MNEVIYKVRVLLVRRISKTGQKGQFMTKKDNSDNSDKKDNSDNFHFAKEGEVNE